MRTSAICSDVIAGQDAAKHLKRAGRILEADSRVSGFGCVEFWNSVHILILILVLGNKH